MEAVTEDLLTTAVHGNIRAGDSIGIWTYDKELRSEEMGLQNWNPKQATSTAQNIMQFLQKHPYKSSSSGAFDDVMTNILRVVEMSDFITVILVSDGNDPVRGTPIDAQLTTFYKNNYQLEKKARMPIVTVIRGEKGEITTNTVSLAPWPIDIPLVPAPIVAKVVAPKPAPTPPPAPVVPSMIVIGKKAEFTTHVPTDLPDHSGDMLRIGLWPRRSRRNFQHRSRNLHPRRRRVWKKKRQHRLFLWWKPNRWLHPWRKLQKRRLPKLW